ncbi:MAG: hypothetical protein WA632_09295 [Gallionella sp.]
MDRLKPLAGKTARFDVAPFSFAYTIQPDGTLQNADPSSPWDALCVIPPSLLPRLALQDELAQGEIQCEGDSSLLAEIFYLSRNLRWDAGDDLSSIAGDVVAERIVRLAQASRRQVKDGVVNFSRAVTEYLTEERPTLANQRLISAFLLQVDTLREDVARLEQRVNRISREHKAFPN